MLPFTIDAFLGVFAAYNAAIWPLQIVAEILGLGAVAVVLWRPPGADAAVAAVLGAMWALMGLGYHLAYFTAINPLAYVFAAMFTAQAVLFGVEGAWRARIRFVRRGGRRMAVAALLLAYALVAYPLIGLLADPRYPETPLFGVAPCPTAIFTIALLLLADYPRRWLLATVPLAWSAIGGSGAILLDVPQDIGLILAGVMLVLFLVVDRRRGATGGGG